MQHKSTPIQRKTEVIATTTVIGGSIKTPHNVRVNGIVEGHLESAGTVILTSGARVGGGIRALESDISGEVDGDISAPKGTVNLRSSAAVSGNITAAQLIVAEGARIQGRCTTTRTHSTREDLENNSLTKSSIRAA